MTFPLAILQCSGSVHLCLDAFLVQFDCQLLVMMSFDW